MQVSTEFADVSSNNGHVDFIAYHGAGHVFIAIKATEGLGYVNPNHRGQSIEAHRFGMGVAHYHFARPDLNDNAILEADHFLRYAEPNTSGRDYLILDLERATPAGWSHDPAWSRAFDEHIRLRSRFRTILYANRSTLEQSVEWFDKAPKRVWDADWSQGPDFAPRGYECVMRQFTDGVFGPEPHTLPGIGQCDVNILRGSVRNAVLRHVHH